MANEGLRDLHVTGFDIQAGVRHAELGGSNGAAVPLVAMEIEGRPGPDADDESLWLRLSVEVARALAAELDRASGPCRADSTQRWA